MLLCFNAWSKSEVSFVHFICVIVVYIPLHLTCYEFLPLYGFEAFKKYFEINFDAQYTISRLQFAFIFYGYLFYRYILPVKWKLRSEHVSEECYFCLNQPKVFGVRWNFRNTIKYTTVESVIPAIRRTRDNSFSPGELRQLIRAIDVDMNDFDVDHHHDTERTFDPDAPQASTSGDPSISPASTEDTSPTWTPDRIERQLAEEKIDFTQQDVNILANELRLVIRQREHLGSRLMDHNIVDGDYRNTAGRGRALTEKFDELFRTDPISKITYCWNIKELFILLQRRHVPEEWRLFIDGSSESLKAVLVHIGNQLPSIPVAYARNVKETYASMQAILMLTQYHLYNWQICGDLKVVAILMGLKQGYAKHQCFLCLWEGRADKLHYDEKHVWEPRPDIDIKEKISQVAPPLIADRSKILLPPLHIKLGLVRNFTKKLPRDGEAYKCLHTFFRGHGLSNAKIEAGKLISIFNIYYVCLLFH